MTWFCGWKVKGHRVNMYIFHTNDYYTYIIVHLNDNNNTAWVWTLRVPSSWITTAQRFLLSSPSWHGITVTTQVCINIVYGMHSDTSLLRLSSCRSSVAILVQEAILKVRRVTHGKTAGGPVRRASICDTGASRPGTRLPARPPVDGVARCTIALCPRRKACHQEVNGDDRLITLSS